MQLTLSGHHVEVTDSLRTYVEEKMQRVDRHNANVNDLKVVLSLEKDRHTVEVTANLSGSQPVHASAEEVDMYVAIDAVVDKLDRQLKKIRDKKQDHRD